MSDVVPDDVTHEESCQEDAYYGVEQIQIVGLADDEVFCQQCLDGVDEEL